MALTLAQVMLGTQVREALDEVVRRIGYDRNRWIENLDLPFYVHRSFSLVVLAAHGLLVYQLSRDQGTRGILKRFTSVLIGLILVETGSGIAMAYFGVPAFLQPLHLTLAIVALGVQFVLLLLLNQEWAFGKSVRSGGRVTQVVS